MYIEVPGRLKKAIEYSMHSPEETVNFYLRDGILYLQTYGDIMSNIRIKILDSDTDSLDMSVILDKTVSLLNGKEPILLNINGDVMEIAQGNFSYSATRSYESRVENKAFECTFDRKFNTEYISRYVQDLKSLDELARTLGLGQSPVSVWSKRGYVIYSNACYKGLIDMPEVCIASETLKKLVTTLNRSRTESCYFDMEQKVIYFQIGENEVVAVSVASTDMQVVEVVDRLPEEMRSIATVDFGNYAQYMETICRVYKKMALQMSVCQDGLAFYISNASTRFNIGVDSEPICTMQLSTPQLQAIYKIFGDAGVVEILKGDNKLCLKQKSYGRELTIAGMIY